MKTIFKNFSGNIRQVCYSKALMVSEDALSFELVESRRLFVQFRRIYPIITPDVRSHTEVGNKQRRSLALDSQLSIHPTITEALVSQSAVVECSVEMSLLSRT